MPKLVGVTEAAGATVETDPWLPLRVKWRVPRRKSWLRLSGAAMLSWECWPPLQGQDLQYSDLTCPLSVAVSAGRLTVWLGPGQPSVGLQADDVVVAVDADGDLLAVSVPWPQQAAELWPEAES